MRRSYLKWAGGKARIAEQILSYVPMSSFRLVEPFVGSGAFSLNASDRARGFLLSDINPDLINLHKIVVNDPDGLVDDLNVLFRPEHNNKESYISLRTAFNRTTDQRRRSTMFLYLNKHGFNGLCRYNASGGFNVPFGDMKSPKIPEKEILNFSKSLKNADFRVQGFETIISESGPGDLLYCDPPYAPLSETASFASYAKSGFGEQEQRQLAKACEEASERGAFVIISNHDTHFTREIYKNASDIISLDVKRSVSASGASRNKAKEILAIMAPSTCK